MPQNKIEIRKITNRIEVRDAGESGALKIEGLAVPFDSNSQILCEDDKKFIETINRNAFAKSLESDCEIMLLYSHDWNSPLARRSVGTLSLNVRDDGLYFEATLPNTTRAKDLIEDIKAGNIYGNSFGFVPTNDKWTRDENGVLNREILDGDLLEISPVVNPAYTATAIESRSLKDFLKCEQSTLKTNADSVRIARFALLKNKINKNKRSK